MDSEKRSFIYEDSRFTWKQLTDEDVTLAWYKGDECIGPQPARCCSQRLSAPCHRVRRRAQTVHNLHLRHQQDLRGGIGESAQEWTGGRAYPDFNVVLIGVAPTDLRWGKRAVAHEFSHLIINRATAQSLRRPAPLAGRRAGHVGRGRPGSRLPLRPQPGHQEQPACSRCRRCPATSLPTADRPAWPTPRATA